MHITFYKIGPGYLMLLMRVVLSLLVLALAASVSACGFRPLYGDVSGIPGTSVVEQLKSTRVQFNHDDRNSFDLGNHLQGLLSMGDVPSSTKYIVRIDVVGSTAEGVLPTRGGRTREDNVTVRCHWQLVELESSRILKQKWEQLQSSYYVTGQAFSDSQSLAQTKKRLAENLSRTVRDELALYFYQQRETQAKEPTP